MSRPGLRAWRRAIQLLLVTAMSLAPFANARDIHWLTGNYFALDLLGLPLGDPLAALQVFFASGGIGGQALFGAGLALLLAFGLGPVFCAYACPFGLLSELVHGLGRKQPYRAHGGKGRTGFTVKAGLAGFGLVAVGLVGLPPLLNHLSMPGWYSRILQQAALGDFLVPALAVPAVLAIEACLGRRLWCRYLCPQSVLLLLAGRLGPRSLRVRFDQRRCTCAKGDRPCRLACSLDLDPRRPKEARLACNNCGDCVAACRTRGQALGLGFGMQPKKRSRQGRTAHASMASPAASDQPGTSPPETAPCRELP